MPLRLIFDDEIEFDVVDCAECGFEMQVPEAWPQPFEITRVQCSRCGAEEYQQWKAKHDQEFRLPDNLPPMIQIDTKDLPGVYRDPLAKKIGQTLELFKK